MEKTGRKAHQQERSDSPANTSAFGGINDASSDRSIGAGTIPGQLAISRTPFCTTPYSDSRESMPTLPGFSEVLPPSMPRREASEYIADTVGREPGNIRSRFDRLGFSQDALIPEDAIRFVADCIYDTDTLTGPLFGWDASKPPLALNTLISIGTATMGLLHPTDDTLSDTALTHTIGNLSQRYPFFRQALAHRDMSTHDLVVPARFFVAAMAAPFRTKREFLTAAAAIKQRHLSPSEVTLLHAMAAFGQETNTLAHVLPKTFGTAKIQKNAIMEKMGEPTTLKSIRRALDEGILPALYTQIPMRDGILAEAETPLSVREREVLQLLKDGASNKEIANTLIVEESTIKQHVGNALHKLGNATRLHTVFLGKHQEKL